MTLKAHLNSIHRFYLLALISCVLLTVGCGPMNARVVQMVPGQLDSAASLKGVVTLQIDGGQDENLMGLPMIPNGDFKEALTQAIVKAGLFSQVADTANAAYRLEAFIFNLSQPMFVSGDVNLEIAWTLVQVESGYVLWQEAITSTGTGFAQGGTYYNKRQATEQAARENIRMAIKHLSNASM